MNQSNEITGVGLSVVQQNGRKDTNCQFSQNIEQSLSESAQQTILTQKSHGTRKYDTTNPHSIESILGINESQSTETQRPLKTPKNKTKKNSKALQQYQKLLEKKWAKMNVEEDYVYQSEELKPYNKQREVEACKVREVTF